jgi:hypothetical protein
MNKKRQTARWVKDPNYKREEWDLRKGGNRKEAKTEKENNRQMIHHGTMNLKAGKIVR